MLLNERRYSPWLNLSFFLKYLAKPPNIFITINFISTGEDVFVPLSSNRF